VFSGAVGDGISRRCHDASESATAFGGDGGHVQGHTYPDCAVVQVTGCHTVTHRLCLDLSHVIEESLLERDGRGM
jgi:hypothetical protein